MLAEVMRILVVEDDKKIGSFVVNGLKQSSFAVDHCLDGEEALVMAETTPYDAAIVDLMLPKLDGLSLIQRLRSKGIRTPILILSAKGSVDDRVKGLQAGSDDYLTKPFAFSELLARIQALIRRASQTTEPTKLTVGDLTLDLLTRQVTRGSETLDLQPREFSLLEYLMRNVGRTVTKTMVLEHVWDYSFDPQTNVVDVLVHRLRAKIDPEKTRLHTIRGVGYALRPPQLVVHRVVRDLHHDRACPDVLFGRAGTGTEGSGGHPVPRQGVRLAPADARLSGAEKTRAGRE